ncbi:MAG TPA: MFS transporter [Actinomycetes bacterium]|nr:MFS transporter [Actinomycetes bacterium]
MRELLRDRDFRLLFAGQTLSMFGDMAMLLVLAMWAKDLTGSNGIAGSVFAALVVPSLLAPLAGVVIDRFKRRTVMIVTDLATAAVVLLLLLVDGREDLWLLYVVAFLYGASLVAFSSARSALLPAMVDDDLLGQANGSLGTGREALRLVAPLAGAALYAGFGGPAVAILDASTFLISAAALLALRVDEPKPAPRVAGGFTVEAAAGGRHLLGDPVLRTTVVATVICMLALGISESVYFAIVDEGLGRPVTFVGVLSAVQGVGAILAGITITGVIRRTGELRPMAWAFAVLAVGVALTTTGRLVPVAAGVLLFGAGLPVLVVCMTTAIQRRTPAGLQGRAFTAFELFAGVPQLLSILGGAVAVTLVDYRIPLSVMGIGLAAAGVYSWRQLREAPEPAETEGSVLADPAGVDVHVPVAADVVQQPPVVGHEQDGPVVRR